MLYIFSVVIVLLLIFDYTKDRKIKKCLRNEKEQAINNFCDEENK